MNYKEIINEMLKHASPAIPPINFINDTFKVVTQAEYESAPTQISVYGLRPIWENARGTESISLTNAIIGGEKHLLSLRKGDKVFIHFAPVFFVDAPFFVEEVNEGYTEYIAHLYVRHIYLFNGDKNIAFDIAIPVGDKANIIRFYAEWCEPMACIKNGDIYHISKSEEETCPLTRIDMGDHQRIEVYGTAKIVNDKVSLTLKANFFDIPGHCLQEKAIALGVDMDIETYIKLFTPITIADSLSECLAPCNWSKNKRQSMLRHAIGETQNLLSP